MNRGPLIVLIALLAGMSTARGAEPIGHVKVSTGEVAVARGSESLPLAAGQEVFKDDQLRTGAKSSVGITFKDDTTLAMGANGLLVLDELAFEPVEDKMNMGLQMVRGTFAVVTGQIAKLAPERMAFNTPVMTIGIRGTSFLVEVPDAQ